MIVLVFMTFVDLFVPAFSAVVVLRVVLSYLMRPGTKVMDILAGMTEPMLGPVRQLLPKSPGLDFAPLVTLLLLQGLQYLLHMLF